MHMQMGKPAFESSVVQNIFGHDGPDSASGRMWLKSWQIQTRIPICAKSLSASINPFQPKNRIYNKP